MAPTVAVLLCTYDGERFLEEQLVSLSQQNVDQIDVFASDDGSSDNTPAILKRWQAGWTKGRFEITEGPRRGFAENFRSLFLRGDIRADFVACCDQDDVWDPDKLSAAITALPVEVPAVYFSRTRLVDASGRLIGYSPLFSRPPSFRNAIVQSIGGGNTMVLNGPGFALLGDSARRTSFITHDWWAYLIVAGAGGLVVYDPMPHIAYRQHDSNLVGKNIGFGAGATRLVQLLKGRFARWTETNLDALNACSGLLTADARAVVSELALSRRTAGPAGLARLLRVGVYRQTALGQMGLYTAALLGRF